MLVFVQTTYNLIPKYNIKGYLDLNENFIIHELKCVLKFKSSLIFVYEISSNSVEMTLQLHLVELPRTCLCDF